MRTIRRVTESMYLSCKKILNDPTYSYMTWNQKYELSNKILGFELSYDTYRKIRDTESYEKYLCINEELRVKMERKRAENLVVQKKNKDRLISVTKEVYDIAKSVLDITQNLPWSDRQVLIGNRLRSRNLGNNISLETLRRINNAESYEDYKKWVSDFCYKKEQKVEDKSEQKNYVEDMLAEMIKTNQLLEKLIEMLL